MEEDKYRLANKGKFDIFIEVAKGLNNVFSVVPIVTGSLGLCRIIGDFKEAADIDVWVPRKFLKERWKEIINFMKSMGFELKDEHEHEFSRNEEIVAFGSGEDLFEQTKISPDALSVSQVGEIKFKEFTAQQYLNIYRLMLRDNYRQEKRGKDDQGKIKLIEEYIKNKNMETNKLKIFLNTISWGFILWIFGYVLGFVFFAFVPKDMIGWWITPFGIAFALWVLLKKIKREKFMCYIGLGVVWTIMAIVLDYIFIVRMLNSANYYKLDVYIYYATTLLLPIAIGWYKKAKGLIK